MTRDNRVYVAWVIALIATIGSLYLSEVRGFRPCVLCWYQRICMYPQALLLGIAALNADLGVRRYALPLSGIGWMVAAYQNLETWGVVPVVRACTSDPSSSCGTPWPVWGADSPLNTVVTIPVMAWIAFTLIIALLSWRHTRTP